MSPPLKVGCVNENLSGHASFHRQLVAAVERQAGVSVRTRDLPDRPDHLLYRFAANPWPLRPGWDWDLALFRHQVTRSFAARPALRDLAPWADVLHFYTQNACPLPGRLLRGRPYVFTADATAAQAARHFGFRYPGHGSAVSNAAATAVERRFARGASQIVVQSRWARTAFVEDLGVDPDKVHVVHLGAPRPFAAIDRSQRRGGPVRVIFVGASMTRKGGTTLLEVLDRRLGHDVELHLVTRERVAARPGVVVHNDVRPGDGGIERLLAAADVFALPTDMDMSPNAVLEAMAAGLPVVAYRTGALPEMVLDGRTGLLVDPHDRAGLAAALDALIASPERRVAMGRAGRSWLADGFDQDRGVTRWLDVLRRAAGVVGAPCA